MQPQNLILLKNKTEIIAPLIFFSLCEHKKFTYLHKNYITESSLLFFAKHALLIL